MSKWIFGFCSLCIGFGAGFFFNEINATSQKKTSSYVSGVESNEPNAHLQNTQSSTPSKRLNNGASTSSSTAQASINVEEWLAEKPPLGLKQLSALILKISEMDEVSLTNALSYFVTTPVDKDAVIVMSSLVSRLVELSPLKAWDHVTGLNIRADVKQNLQASVIRDWSRQSPMEVFDWFLDNELHLSGSAENTSLSALIFYEMAQKDIDGALQSVSLLNSERVKSSAFNGIFVALQTPEQFSDTLSNEQIINDYDLQENLIRIWTVKDTDAVKTWFERLEENTRKDDIRLIIFHDYVNTAPLDAASWYVAHSKPDTLQSDVEHAARFIAFSNPDAALNWVKRQPDADIKKATVSLLLDNARRSPNFAEKNLDLVTDKDKKVEIAFYIYATYKNKNEQRAKDFLNSFEYKEALSKRIESTYKGLTKSN